MKKIKDLKMREIQEVCNKNDENCLNCPLLITAQNGEIYCLKSMEEVPFWLLEETYEKLNQEIEV